MHSNLIYMHSNLEWTSSNLEWTSSEFVAELGCFIKWLHGDPGEKIEKLYSMSAFHYFNRNEGFDEYNEYNKYAEYLDISVNSIIKTTDWNVRIYIDESILTPSNKYFKIWEEKLSKLRLPRIQIICVKMPRYYLSESNTHQGLLAVIFRYLAMFDKNTSIILFRDIDNVWTEQHHYFVEKWLSGREDIFLFMNTNYKRQEIKELTKKDVILEDKYYTSIFSGLWSIRKPMNTHIPYSVWHKMFGYIESYTDFVNLEQYENFLHYKNRFTYGFDELMLTRVTIPILMSMGLSIYALPIKIYEAEYFKNFLEDVQLKKFLKIMVQSDDLEILTKIVVDNYWKMTTPNAGLSQYIVCIITNIYFNLIAKKNQFYKTDKFINALKYKIYPVPIIMSVGLFTFKNFNKYNWFDDNGGAAVVADFIKTNKRISLSDFTARSDLSNEGNGTPKNPYNII